MVIDPQNITIMAAGIAFLAGLVSFLSPCVLPLVPAYIGYLGGAVVTPEGVVVQRRDALLHATAFVLGFSAIFVILGASVGLVGYLLQDSISVLVRAGAVLLVVFGQRVANVRMGLGRWLVAALVVALVTYGVSLGTPEVRLGLGVMLGLVVLAGAELPRWALWALGVGAGAINLAVSNSFPVQRVVESVLIAAVVIAASQTDLFYMEKRFDVHKERRGNGLWTSVLMGAVFGAGWTPCVGPNLAAIFFLASAFQTVWIGAALLAIYSAGLAIPFLLVGGALGLVTGYLRRMNRYLGVISLVNGMLLIFMGILLLSDRLAFLASLGTFFDVGL